MMKMEKAPKRPPKKTPNPLKGAFPFHLFAGR